MKARIILRQWFNAAIVELTPAAYRPKWIDWHTVTAADDSVVVVTSADPEYFRRFAPAFISTLAAKCPSASVHFHLYDAEPECLRILAAWRERLPSLRIGHSSEKLPKSVLRPPRPKHANRQSWKSLHICCSRFLAAEELQRRCGKPILLMDIDVMFMDSIDGLFADADYGLMPRLSSGKWCKRTLGGVVYVSNSEVGRHFLGRACRYIRKFLALRRLLYWFAFDQYALYRAMVRMQQHPSRPRFRALTEAHIGFEPESDAPIFYPKGRRKERTEFMPVSGATFAEGP